MLNECEHDFHPNGKYFPYCAKCHVGDPGLTEFERRWYLTHNGPDAQTQHISARDDHDEAMRMQALAIAAAIAPLSSGGLNETDLSRVAPSRLRRLATWAYHEATGREW